MNKPLKVTVAFLLAAVHGGLVVIQSLAASRRLLNPAGVLEAVAASKVLVWRAGASFKAGVNSKLSALVAKGERALSSAQPGVPADCLRQPLN